MTGTKDFREVMHFMKKVRKMLHDKSADDMSDLQMKIDSDVRLAATKL